MNGPSATPLGVDNIIMLAGLCDSPAKVQPNCDDIVDMGGRTPWEMQVPDKIRGFNASDAAAPVKGSSGGVSAADKNRGAAASTTATAAPTADHVTLTGSARILQKLSDAVAGAPVVNAAKVATVKQAVQSGRYQVDAGRVADKLLKFERGLE